MKSITYSDARQNLAQTMNKVCEDHDSILITRKKAQSVILMSLEDYNSIAETAYLLQSPANAKRLYDSIQQYEQGDYQSRDIIE